MTLLPVFASDGCGSAVEMQWHSSGRPRPEIRTRMAPDPFLVYSMAGFVLSIPFDFRSALQERVSLCEEKLHQYSDWSRGRCRILVVVVDTMFLWMIVHVIHLLTLHSFPLHLVPAPLRPSTTINYQAATRFIEHSLPDLTPGAVQSAIAKPGAASFFSAFMHGKLKIYSGFSEQRRSMKDISRREGANGRSAEHRGSRKKRKYETSDNKSVRAAAQEFLEKAARELLGSNGCGLKGPLRDIASEEEEAQMN